MRLSELEKWRIVETDYHVVVDYTDCLIFSAPMGDFLREYTAHLSIPWWKRMWWSPEWDVVEKIMRSALNQNFDVVWTKGNNNG